MRYANLNPACQVIESSDQDSARARRCIPGTSLRAPLPASENYSKGGGAHITFHLGRCESSQNDQTSRHRLRQSKLSPGKNRDADDRPFAAGFFPVPLIQRSDSRRADRARRGSPGKRTTQRGSRPDSPQDSAPSNDEDHTPTTFAAASGRASGGRSPNAQSRPVLISGGSCTALPQTGPARGTAAAAARRCRVPRRGPGRRPRSCACRARLAGLSSLSLRGLVGGGCGAGSGSVVLSLSSVGAGELPAPELALQGPEGGERRAAGQAGCGGQDAAGGLAGGPAQAHGGGPPR